MTPRLRALHAKYKSLEIDAELARREFERAVREHIREMPYVKTALALGISNSHFADIRAGRRGISDEVFRKLEELK